MTIALSQPDIGELEIEYVTKALRSGKLSLGPQLSEFEAKFANYVGARYAIATNSGTSALHLSVRAIGIGPQDEVVTTSFSFVASANCLLYEGAFPVFVDIHPATLNLDPEQIRQKLAAEYVWDRASGKLIHRHSRRTLKAILPVHIFGAPCDMDSILQIANEYNLSILEDACEALGSRYRGKPVGTLGNAAAFGFYPNKQITTGEGGMIVTNDPQIAARCRSLRNQGRDGETVWLRHVTLGYNYRLSDLHAALGLAQLTRIEELLSARAGLAAEYTRTLSSVPGIIVPRETAGNDRSWFAYVIQIAKDSPASIRDTVMSGLRARGIACQAYFPPIHRQPYFQRIHLSSSPSLPITESAADRCLALPFFPSMTKEQVAEVSAAIAELLSEELAGTDSRQKHYSASAGSAR